MKKIRSGTGYIIVDAHDRSTPSDPRDKWGNLKSQKKKRKHRRKSGIKYGNYDSGSGGGW